MQSTLHLQEEGESRREDEVVFGHETVESVEDASAPIEYREEFRFKNGAVYRGQWKG